MFCSRRFGSCLSLRQLMKAQAPAKRFEQSIEKIVSVKPLSYTLQTLFTEKNAK